jgi:rsbT co-antagonist protein RsbR
MVRRNRRQNRRLFLRRVGLCANWVARHEAANERESNTEVPDSSKEIQAMSTTPVNARSTDLASILARKQDVILAEWIREMGGSVRRNDLLKEADLQAECAQMLRLMREALEAGGGDVQFQSAAWDAVREMLSNISRSRAIQGFTPGETASFVFSAKRPLFTQIREESKGNSDLLASGMWAVTELLDAMGVYTTQVYQKSREEVIRRQQEELLELSTPVVKLWEGILALPIIGTLDSARTQVVMESLLDAIVKTNSRIAIIDITGVPTVDTIVAQHLLKTVTAARLMGADCIISGVRPQIAQTIVHLGINLLDVTTKATLASAFLVALQKLGITFSASAARA